MTTDRTLTKKTSHVYAATLLEALSGPESIFEVTGQLRAVYKAVTGTIELRNTLTDNGIPLEARTGILSELFAGYDPALLAVLGVIVERDDIRLLPRINEEFAGLAEDRLDAVIIDVTTAIALDDTLRDSIKKKYSAQLGKNVLLREQVDPSIVGGIILSTHGQRIDASVVTQLENARSVLSTVSSGGGR
jgi:F-type H+-transporting ATPase subunit delta